MAKKKEFQQKVEQQDLLCEYSLSFTLHQLDLVAEKVMFAPIYVGWITVKPAEETYKTVCTMLC